MLSLKGTSMLISSSWVYKRQGERKHKRIKIKVKISSVLIISRSKYLNAFLRIKKCIEWFIERRVVPLKKKNHEISKEQPP